MTATKATESKLTLKYKRGLSIIAVCWLFIGGMYVINQHNKGVRPETVRLYLSCISDPTVKLNCEPVNPFIP